MKRVLLLTLLLAAGAAAQFHGLSTTEDGSVLYFSSAARQRGSQQYAWDKLFAVDGSGVRLVAQREQGEVYGWTVTNFYALQSPEVSADGSVLAFTGWRHCGGGSGCLPIERHQARVLGLPEQPDFRALGAITISPNGRYGVLYWTNSMLPPYHVRWVDFATNTTIDIDPYPPAATRRWSLPDRYVRRRVANDGSVLVSSSTYPFETGLGLWSKDGVIPLHTSCSAAAAMISMDAARIVYETSEQPARLIRYELANQQERVLAEAPGPLQFSVTGNAVDVLYLAPAGSVRQAFLVRGDAPAVQITDEPSGITEAVIAGNGLVAWAVTGDGRILKIDLNSGAAVEFIARTPIVTSVDHGSASWAKGGAPGSLMRVAGSALAASVAVASFPLPDELGGVQVKLDGQRLPVYYVSPTDIRFQLPWELPPSDYHFELDVEDTSEFLTGPDTLRIQQEFPRFYAAPQAAGGYSPLVLAIHTFFDAIITKENPAWPGEIIHVYAAGLGPVEPPAPTGRPSPLIPLSWVAGPLTCEIRDGETKPVEIFFAGLAPGMVGIYQLSVRLPEDVDTSRRQVTLACGFPDFYPEAIGKIPVASSGPAPEKSAGSRSSGRIMVTWESDKEPDQ